MKEEEILNLIIRAPVGSGDILLRNVWHRDWYAVTAEFEDGKKAYNLHLGKPISLIKGSWEIVVPDKDIKADAENSGGSCDYYSVHVMNPTTPDANVTQEMNVSGEYIAECNDIIESLNMTYAEANIFKEIWRTAAARTLGKQKANHTSKRGAEKIIFFAERHGVAHVVSK